MMSSRRRAVLLLLQWKYALPGFLQLPTGIRRCRMIEVIGIVVSFAWPWRACACDVWISDVFCPNDHDKFVHLIRLRSRLLIRCVFMAPHLHPRPSQPVWCDGCADQADQPDQPDQPG